MTSVALVIGAGDALGGAIAQRFARGGMVVVPSRRKEAPLKELALQIESEGGTAHPITCDARDEDEVIALFDRIDAELGVLEVCVFNAGAWHHASTTEMTSRIYRQVWETACFAGFLIGREAARRMVPRGRGSIFLLARLLASVAVPDLQPSQVPSSRFALWPNRWRGN